MPLKHTLNGMDTEDGFGIIHWEVILNANLDSEVRQIIYRHNQLISSG